MARRRLGRSRCPKCHKIGPRVLVPVRSTHYAVSSKTTLKTGTWEPIKKRDKKTKEIKIVTDEWGNQIMGYKTHSRYYVHEYYRHYDSITKKRWKCYIR